MTRGTRVAAVGILTVAVVGAATVATVRSHARGHSDATSSRPAHVSPAAQVSITCPSPSLGGSAQAIVYLPAGYRSGSARYRVIYFLHGLPANASSYATNKFVADAVSSGPQTAIVVAPQGARSDNEDHEYLELGPNEDWPEAISHDIPRCIDARFRTIPNRTGRALVGLSAGGYGAANIGLRALNVFGAVESWSGYFEATDPDGTRKLDLGSDAANENARAPRGPWLKGQTRRWPAFIGFYVGRQDNRFLDDNIDFANTLTTEHIPHLYRTYPGGHSGALWHGKARQWLGYALTALAQGR